MSAITTHVLDTALGRPAGGVGLRLEYSGDGGWATVGEGVTDADGRARDLLPAGAPLRAGVYRLTFATGAYHAAQGQRGFYPEAAVTFEVRDTSQHHHVPLLLAPHGYTTYRGS